MEGLSKTAAEPPEVEGAAVAELDSHGAAPPPDDEEPLLRSQGLGGAAIVFIGF